MDDVLLKAYAASQQGRTYAFATIVEATLKGTPRKAGAKMIVFNDGSSFGSIGGGRNEKAAIAACLESIKLKKTQSVVYNYFGRKGESVCGGQMKVFIEPVVPLPEAVICGAGHIALPLSVILTMTGFKVKIYDDRRIFANRKRFSHVNQIKVGQHAQLLSKHKITSNTYILIVTQGNEQDFECLRTSLKSDAAYIGVISSKPKRVKFLSRLREEGYSQSRLKAIHIPMGFDIGAQTPAEIAVSIAAQVIAIKNQAYIGTDKFLS